MCVFEIGREWEREEEVDLEVIYAWEYEICCMDNQEVIVRCHLKVNPHPCWVVGPRSEEGKGRILGFLCLSPYYDLIMKFFGPITSRYNYYDPLGLYEFVVTQ